MPKITRPFNPEWSDAYDHMTERDKQWSFLFDLAVILIVLGSAYLFMKGPQ